MNKKHKKPVKHIPQRTCVGCRQVLAKRSLVRIVRTPEGVVIDATGKANGRGAYLHDQRSCWQHALKGPLAHALKTEFSSQERQLLQDYLANLPVEENSSLQ